MQIREMTLDQISEYINSWIEEVKGSQKEKKEFSSVDELELFNLTAGIPRIQVPKK